MSVVVDSELLSWIVTLVFFFNAFLLYSPFAVAIEKPTGLRLSRRHYPTLFKEIDAVRKQLRLRKIHGVWLNDELNAGAAQLSRVLRVGPLRNEILIGLPLMEAVRLDEFRGILAHELAHLSRKHGHFLVRVIGLREGWSEAAEPRGFFVVRLLLGRFARWYWPNLRAHLDVQGRLEEQEADRLAIAGTDANALRSGKARTTMLDHLVMDDYIESLNHQSALNEEPPSDAVSQLIEKVRGSFDDDEVYRAIVRSLADTTEAEETHPSLQESLVAMGWKSHGSMVEDAKAIQAMLAPAGLSASECLFPDKREALRSELDARWKVENAELWAESHQLGQGQRRTLDRIEKRLKERGELSLEDAVIRAKLTHQLEGRSQAIPLFREVLQRDPRCAEASLELGLCLVKEDDVAGAVLLERAIEIEPDFAFPAAEALASFCREREDSDSAEKWTKEMLKASDKIKASEIERVELGREDTLLPHPLSAERLEELCDAFTALGGIEQVWGAQKQLEHIKQPPMIVLVVEGKRKGWWGSELDLGEIEGNLLVNVPAIEHLYIVDGASNPTIQQKIESLGQDARIFG